MASAFFLGAFVTAHFLMLCSRIHWIHSLSPFTMGRPFSTARQTHLNVSSTCSTGIDMRSVTGQLQRLWNSRHVGFLCADSIHASLSLVCSGFRFFHLERQLQVQWTGSAERLTCVFPEEGLLLI